MISETKGVLRRVDGIHGFYNVLILITWAIITVEHELGLLIYEQSSSTQGL